LRLFPLVFGEPVPVLPEGDSQELGSLRLHAFGLLERFGKEGLLDPREVVVQVQAGFGQFSDADRLSLGRLHRGPPEAAVLGEDDLPLDDVLQFPHVSLELLVHHLVNESRINLVDRLGEFL